MLLAGSRRLCGLRVDFNAQRDCPRCGQTIANDDEPGQPDFFRPWHIMHGRDAVRSYVASLGDEANEWLLALYVGPGMRLLAVDTLARGDKSEVTIPFCKLAVHAYQLNASGFILVHNHPSGDPTPSRSDYIVTGRVARMAEFMEMRLIDHFIIAGDEMRSCGYFDV